MSHGDFVASFEDAHDAVAKRQAQKHAMQLPEQVAALAADVRELRATVERLEAALLKKQDLVFTKCGQCGRRVVAGASCNNCDLRSIRDQ